MPGPGGTYGIIPYEKRPGIRVIHAAGVVWGQFLRWVAPRASRFPTPLGEHGAGSTASGVRCRPHRARFELPRFGERKLPPAPRRLDRCAGYAELADIPNVTKPGRKGGVVSPPPFPLPRSGDRHRGEPAAARASRLRSKPTACRF